MSFFGGSTSAMPTTAQKPLGLDAAKASTNEQARPVPYLAGKTRVGVTWITDAFGIKTVAVSTQVGKGQSTTTGYKYYADLGALVCHGPVDALETVYLNSDKVWTSGITRATEDYADITIASHGTMRLYWGTPTQTADLILQASGFAHPPYKRQCYLRFDQLYFGFNQTNAPNVELVLARYPALDWFTAAVNVGDDCNPIAILGEWLTNPIFGLGWPVDRLDVDALNEVAEQLATEGIGLSPYITEQSSAREVITSLLEYFDGYAVFSPEGKFSIALVRSPDDVDALPPVTSADLVKEPDLNPDSWANAKTKTWVKFKDSVNEYQDNAVPYRDPVAASVMTDNTPQTLERPWVTRQSIAQTLVAAAGRAAAIPSCTAKLSVRKSAAVPPGGLLRLNYPDLNITDLLLRVSSYSVPSPGAQTVDLEVALDRSYLNDSFYLPPDDAAVTPTVIEPVPFVAEKLMELPLALSAGVVTTTNLTSLLGGNAGITLAPLVARPNLFTTGFNILLRDTSSLTRQTAPLVIQQTIGTGTVAVTYPTTPTIDETLGLVVNFGSGLGTSLASAATQAKLVLSIGGEILWVIEYHQLTTTSARLTVVRGRFTTRNMAHTSGTTVVYWLSKSPQYTITYTALGSSSSFGQHGVLTADYPAATPLMDQAVGIVVQLDGADQILEEMTVGDALGNTLLLWVGGEIISIIGADLLGPGNYRIYGIRGRYDTQAQAHTTGDEAYIIRRDSLKLMTHSSFILGASVRMKLQPIVVATPLDLSEVDTVGITLVNRRALPPAPTNLAAFGDHSNPTYTTGQSIPLTWTPTTEQPGDYWARFGDAVAPTAKTILQFLTTAGVVKRTLAPLAAGITSYTYPTATLAADFGGQPTFLVRAWQTYGTSKQSLYYTELKVTKI